MARTRIQIQKKEIGGGRGGICFYQIFCLGYITNILKDICFKSRDFLQLSRLCKYSLLFADTEVNNSFSIYQTSE